MTEISEGINPSEQENGDNQALKEPNPSSTVLNARKSKVLTSGEGTPAKFITSSIFTTKRFDDAPKMKEIETNYFKINELLKLLEGKIGLLLKHNEEDFLLAYKDQMFQVQKELKMLKKKIDEETLKQKTDDKINILEEERDYFRSEALRLDKITKDQQKLIDEFKFKNKILTEDKSYYEGFVIETKKENKALRAELLHLYSLQGSQVPQRPQTQQGGRLEYASLRGSEDLNGKKNENEEQFHQNLFPTQQSQEDFSQKPMRRFYSSVRKPQVKSELDVEKLISDVVHLKENEEKYIDKINNMKANMEKEKLNFRKYKGEQIDKVVQRTDLEKILLDSINEVKKDVARRKLNIPNKELNFQLPFDFDPLKFGPTDKKKIVENFMNNDKVLSALYNLIFNPFSSAMSTKPSTANLAESWKQNAVEIDAKIGKFKSFRLDLLHNSAKPYFTKEMSSVLNNFSKKTRTIIHKIKTE